MPFPTRFSFSKSPIDEDIKKRDKTAGDPPKEAGFPNQSGGPGSSPNPDNDTAPSVGKPKKGVESDEEGKKAKLSEMQWQLGSITLEVELDPMTGYAKWPLSFKRIEKDTKRPNKPNNPSQNPKVGEHKTDDQPPTAA